MMMGWRRSWAAFLMLAAVHGCPTFLAAAQHSVPIGMDYTVQGEYVGDLPEPAGKSKTGVQVLALGKGEFRAVAFSGGLPGEGWDQSPTHEFDGKLIDGMATFQDGDNRITVKGDTASVTNRAGAVVGELKKVQRNSPTLGAKPPDGAIVLFDGTSANSFDNGSLTDGLLKPGATSKQAFQSGTLHVEFYIPFDPQDTHRGNSGVYLQSRYEVQILNSFGLKAHNHECGGIPSVKEPDVNMSFPPGVWQTYDVDFTAAEYQDGKKQNDARMTVRHNGVVIHNNVEVPQATTSSPQPEGPEPGPINLQEHGSDVRFRNIWFLEKP